MHNRQLACPFRAAYLDKKRSIYLMDILNGFHYTRVCVVVFETIKSNGSENWFGFSGDMIKILNIRYPFCFTKYEMISRRYLSSISFNQPPKIISIYIFISIFSIYWFDLEDGFFSPAALLCEFCGRFIEFDIILIENPDNKLHFLI